MSVPHVDGEPARQQTLGEELRSSALLLALAVLVTVGVFALVQLTVG